MTIEHLVHLLSGTRNHVTDHVNVAIGHLLVKLQHLCHIIESYYTVIVKL